MVKNFTVTYNKGEGDIGVEITDADTQGTAVNAVIADTKVIPTELITDYTKIETATGNAVPTAKALKEYVDAHSVQSLEFELLQPTKPSSTDINPAVIGNNRTLKFRVTKDGIPRKQSNWLMFYINGVGERKNFSDDDGHIEKKLNIGAVPISGNKYSNQIGVTMACDWTSQYSAVEGIHINYDCFPYVRSSTSYTSGNGDGYYNAGSISSGGSLNIPILKNQSGSLEDDTSIKFILYIHGGQYVRTISNGNIVKDNMSLPASTSPYEFTVYRYGGTATTDDAIKADYSNHYLIGGGCIKITS